MNIAGDCDMDDRDGEDMDEDLGDGDGWQRH